MESPDTNNGNNEKFDLIMLASTLHELNLTDAKNTSMSGSCKSTKTPVATTHNGDTQKNLNSLYTQQVDALTKELKYTLNLLSSTKTQSSVLDIGCGQVPYSKLLLEHIKTQEIKLTLWDTCSTLDNEDIFKKAKCCFGEKCKNKERKENGDAFQNLQKLQIDGETAIRESFLDRLFVSISNKLNYDGFFLLGEFYYPSYLSAQEKKEIVELLNKYTSHGDPPAVFYDPDELCMKAMIANFTVERITYVTPIVQLNNLNNAFPDMTSDDWKCLSKRKYCIALLQKKSEKKTENEKNLIYANNIPQTFFAEKTEQDMRKKLPKLTAIEKKLQEKINLPFKTQQIELILTETLNTSGSDDFSLHNLSNTTNQFIDLWGETIVATPSTYSALWISLSSKLLVQEHQSTNQKYGRFNISYDPERGDKQEKKLYRSYTYLTGEKLWENNNLPNKSIIKRGEDWSSIAYNYLLAPDGIQFDSDVIPKISGPSIHAWIANIAKNASNEKDFPWIRSVTFYCESVTENKNISSQLLLRELMEKHQLCYKWSSNNNYVEGKALDENLNKYLVPQKEGIPSFCELGNEDLRDETHKSIYKEIRQYMFEAFNDFILLGIEINSSENSSNGKKPHPALNEFKNKWTNDKIKFCRNYNDAKDASKDSYIKCFFPEKYKENIETAISQATSFIDDCHTAGLSFKLPLTWTTVSLGVPGSSIPLPSFMRFSDNLLGLDCIENIIVNFLRQPLLEYLGTEEKVLHILKKTQIKDASRKAARAAILARNFSHVMGSHVISNPDFIDAMVGKQILDSSRSELDKWIKLFDETTDEYITKGYESADTKGYWTRARSVFENIQDMLTSGGTLLEQSRRFHHYLQGRFDFIARSIDETEDSVEPVYFINDMMDGFLTQTAFLDTLVSDLGVRLTNINFRIEFPEKNNVFRTKWFPGDAKQKKSDNNSNWSHEWEKISGNKESIEECDFMVGLPGGMIASQAFFALLENVIRNSVKYKSDTTKATNYQLTIKITEETIDTEETYQLTLYDNFSGGWNTYQTVLTHAQKDILDDNGKPLTEGLGIQEMKICAKNLLPEKLSDILKKEYEDNDYKNTAHLRPQKPKYKNSAEPLTYELNIAKPVLVAIWRTSDEKNIETGIIRATNKLEDIINYGAHILVIDGERKIKKEDIKSFIKLVNFLPYRIIVVCNPSAEKTENENNDKRACKEMWDKLITNHFHPNRIKPIADSELYEKLITNMPNIEDNKEKKAEIEDYIINCYDAWLRTWKGNKTWDLWLGFQRSESQIANTWNPLLEKFGMRDNSLINIFVKNAAESIIYSNEKWKHHNQNAKDDKSNKEYWTTEIKNTNFSEKKALVFDNHGECFEDAYEAEKTQDFRKSTRFYQKFGSVTPDLYRILSSPPATKFGFAFFIYSLVESCLTNVGVVDERIAGDLLFADKANNDSANPEFNKKLSDHQKTGVFPIFRLKGIENVQTKHDGDYSDRHKAKTTKIFGNESKEGITYKSITEDNKTTLSCEAKLAIWDSDKSKWGFIPVHSDTEGHPLDILIIHEGALDLLFSTTSTDEEKNNFCKELLKIVPSVIRTSGRGRHTRHFAKTLPFIEFNEVSSALLTSRNKYALVRGLLGTTGDKSQADKIKKER